MNPKSIKCRSNMGWYIRCCFLNNNTKYCCCLIGGNSIIQKYKIRQRIIYRPMYSGCPIYCFLKGKPNCIWLRERVRHTLAKRWRACSIIMEIVIKMKHTTATAHVGVVSKVITSLPLFEPAICICLFFPGEKVSLFRN